MSLFDVVTKFVTELSPEERAQLKELLRNHPEEPHARLLEAAVLAVESGFKPPEGGGIKKISPVQGAAEKGAQIAYRAILKAPELLARLGRSAAGGAGTGARILAWGFKRLSEVLESAAEAQRAKAEKGKEGEEEGV